MKGKLETAEEIYAITSILKHTEIMLAGMK